MKVERIYKGEESLNELLMEILESQIDSLLSRIYDKEKANTVASHDKETERKIQS